MTRYLLITFSCILLCSSCHKDDSLEKESVFPPIENTEETRDLETWIVDNITLPYGVRVFYKFNEINSEGDITAYPPNIHKIRPILEAVRKLFFELYNDPRVSKRPFLLEKGPIHLYLYGGPNNDLYGVPLLYNKGSVPTDMYIYNVNAFRPGNAEDIYILMRSIHHQFARRLMEVFPYPKKTFDKESQRTYTHSMNDLKDIFNSSETEAAKYRSRYYSLRNGCMTLYAMVNAESDFAENISITLTEPRSAIQKAFKDAAIPLPWANEEERLISEQRAKIAQSKVTRKYFIVEDYFKNEIKISLSRLQLLSNKKIQQYLKEHE